MQKKKQNKKESINDLLIKNNLQNKYVSILNQLKSEIDFFVFYYEQYKKQKLKGIFKIYRIYLIILYYYLNQIIKIIIKMIMIMII